MRGGLLFPFLLGLGAGAVLVWSLGADDAKPERTRAAPTRGTAHRSRKPAAAERDPTAPATEKEKERAPDEPHIAMPALVADALADLEQAEWGSEQTGLLAIARLYALAGRTADVRRVVGRLLEMGMKPKMVFGILRLLPKARIAETLEAICADHAGLEWSPRTRADLALWAGDTAHAIEIMRRGIANGQNVEALAKRYIRADPDAAFTFLRAYVNGADWSAGVAEEIGEAFLEAEKPQAALPFLRRALELAPQHNEALSHLAQIDADEARRFAELRVEKFPDDGDGWQRLGQLRHKTGDTAGAFAAYRKAIALKNDEDLLWELFQVDRVRALPVVQKIREGSTNDEMIGMMGDIYREYGMDTEALEEYVAAHRLDTTDTEWLRKITKLSPTRAIELLGKEWEEHGESLGDEMIGAYANALLAVGRKSAAFEYYAIAMRKDPGDGEWLRGLADSDPARAVPLLEKHLEQSPTDRDRIGALATALANAGRRDDALTHFRRATEGSGGRGWFVPMARAAPHEAIARMRARLDKKPDDDEDWGTLGKIYAELGRLSEARAAFQRAQELDPSDNEWPTKLRELD